jgi:hypothetical protein
MGRFLLFIGCLLWLPLTGCASSGILKGPHATAKGTAVMTPHPTVTVGITHATLGRNIARNAAFWWHSVRVVGSLEKTPGLLAYNVDIGLLKGEAWTLTVWQTPEQLDAFVLAERHSAAMANGYSALRAARFARLTLPADQVPTTWAAVRALMTHAETTNTGYKSLP